MSSIAVKTLCYTYTPGSSVTYSRLDEPLIMGDGKAHRIELDYPSDLVVKTIQARFLRGDGTAVTWQMSSVVTQDRCYAYAYLPQSCYLVPGNAILSVQIDSSAENTTYHDSTVLVISATVISVTGNNILTGA